MAFLGQEEQLREFQNRFKYLHLCIFLGFGIVLGRLVYLQILQGDKLRDYSEENRIKKVVITAPRGMIFDRYGKLLVDNRPAFDLEVVPQYLRESKKKKEVLNRLSSLIDLPLKNITKKLRKAKRQYAFLPVKLKANLGREEMAKIETWKLDMPGVAVEMEIHRTNLFGKTSSHLLGYISKVNHAELPRLNRRGRRYGIGDVTGKSGIERQFEDVLRGVDGHELVEVDALGRKIREKKGGGLLVNKRGKQAVPGKNLVLTIDQDLQDAAVKAFGTKAGGAVAVDPATGEILTMVSHPGYDPTAFSRGIATRLWKSLLNNSQNPLRDKTLQDHYSPGSLFKVITAVAGLEEGVITPTTKLRCGGQMRVGKRTFHCHRWSGHGEIDVVTALARSCDVFFYRVAQKLKSVNEIAKWAFRFGLGKRTGITLPREVPGLIPTEQWKERRYNRTWTPGETLNVGIGQGFVLTTVTQLAGLYASLVNGGRIYKPIVVKRIESADGEVIKDFSPEVLNEPEVSPETLKVIRKGLVGVVNHPRGTAYSMRLPGIDFAGKTGTVQLIRLSAEKLFQKCDQMKFKYRHHGLFAAYAPIKDPKIAVAVLAEHGCSGAAGAAPIARAIIKTFLAKHYPDRYGPEAVLAKVRRAKHIRKRVASQEETSTE